MKTLNFLRLIWRCTFLQALCTAISENLQKKVNKEIRQISRNWAWALQTSSTGPVLGEHTQTSLGPSARWLLACLHTSRKQLGEIHLQSTCIEKPKGRVNAINPEWNPASKKFSHSSLGFIVRGFHCNGSCKLIADTIVYEHSQNKWQVVNCTPN